MTVKHTAENRDDKNKPKMVSFGVALGIAVASLLLGFVLAGYAAWALTWVSGWRNVTFQAVKEIPPWVSALTAVVAAAISAYAVYLVSKTLQATRETLNATQEMAADTKRIGHAQLRPWVLMKRPEITTTEAGAITVNVEFTNYGVSPAKDLNWIMDVECFGHPVEGKEVVQSKYGVRMCHLCRWAEEAERASYLGPKERCVASVFCREEIITRTRQ